MKLYSIKLNMRDPSNNNAAANDDCEHYIYNFVFNKEAFPVEAVNEIIAENSEKLAGVKLLLHAEFVMRDNEVVKSRLFSTDDIQDMVVESYINMRENSL